MTTPVLLVLGWLFCALISAGIFFAYFQGKFPTLAEQQYREDLAEAIAFGLFLGPFGLLVGIFGSGFCRYGWRLR